MKYVKYPNRARNAILVNRKNYQKVLNIVLKHTEIVCFTVSPYLDDIDEVREDVRYQKILDAYIDFENTCSIHTEDCNEGFIYFKMNYFVQEFLKEKRDIFDFGDEETAINLEDIVFISNERIVCDTITHENYCAVTDELYDEITRAINNI